MKLVFKILLSVVTCLTCVAAHADWSAPGSLSALRVYNGSTIFAGLSSLSAANNQAACGTTGNAGEFALAMGQSYTNSVLAILLSTNLAGKSVAVYLTGGCLGGRPEINGAEVAN